MPHLLVREPGRVAMTVALHADFTIGRDPENDLVLSDRHASRRHARFAASGAAFVISDVGSTHGLIVNRAQARERLLADGDLIQIGNVLIVYRQPDLPVDGGITLTLNHDGLGVVAAGPETRLLRLLDELGSLLSADDNPDELLIRLLDTVVSELGCERAVIGIVDAHGATGGRLVRGQSTDVTISRTVLDRVVKRGESVLVDVAAAEAPETVVREGVKSAMAVPLAGPQGIFGYIYVDDRSRAGRFAAAELHFLAALARLAAGAAQRADDRRRANAVADAFRDAHPVPGLIGESAAMVKVRKVVHRYAAAGDSAVLVRGESGTGKELVASTIHTLSPRSSQPFVTVNCAAIPETLIESELFGHEKGAFTGAAKARRGKFALAHLGTLFLDEVGDLSPAAQAKVLRAIEEGEVQPLGSEQTIRVDVRIISATHKPLADEIAAGRFREDLYYRLAVGEIELPPLRARGEDVVVLARAMLSGAGERLGKNLTDFSPSALTALRRYGWPGNVRQLQNEIERAAILAEASILELEELSRRLAAAPSSDGPRLTLAERFADLDVVERRLVEESLTRASGNVSEAARLLGISRIMLRRRIERFGLSERD